MKAANARHPAAWLPVAMSLAALSLIAFQYAMHGAAPEPDEGAVAHLWQLLVAGQVPLIAFAAMRWLRRTPGPAGAILVVQLLAAAAAVLPVAVLGW